MVPGDNVRLSMKFDRLIVCVGMEKINYEDGSIGEFEYEALNTYSEYQ